VNTNASPASLPVATTPPVQPPAAPDARHSLRVRLAAGALAVVAVLLVLAFLRPRSRDRLVGATRASSIRSIAVLPLENLTGDPSQEYFADGLTDAIVTNLAETTDLRVISRTSTSGYKAMNKPLPPLRVVGRELNADGIIEGAVVRSGGRVRVTAQLIDARSDHHVWAHSYERTLGNIRDAAAKNHRSADRNVGRPT
jgi:TolB-like protein